ncbi:MAG: fused DSP-PTPase phosphatase/NAD kinase-like protein [Limisphaerales bacterium]
MSKARRVRLSASLVVSLLLAVAGLDCLAGPRGVPAQNGIGNFGQVSEHLYRGAQPSPATVTNLSRLGVRLIIDLREPDKRSEEGAAARAAGLSYTNMPLRGLGRPTGQQVKDILALIDSSPGPVFIHCKHGCDRTGTIVACYRIQHDGWTSGEALKEAVHYGMSRLERGMKAYVAEFGRTSTPALSAKR